MYSTNIFLDFFFYESVIATKVEFAAAIQKGMPQELKGINANTLTEGLSVFDPAFFWPAPPDTYLNI